MRISNRKETEYIKATVLNPAPPTQGNLNERVLHFTRQIHENPKSAEAYYQRARALYSKGDLSGAKADFDLTLKWVPNHKGAQIGQTLLASRVRRSA